MSMKSPSRGYSEAKNLHGNTLPPVANSNLNALLDRPCAKRGYLPRPIKAQDKAFQELRRKNAYFGAVDVLVSDCPTLKMLNMNDDQVASIYFYFGMDAFEPLSVYLFNQLARQKTVIFDIGSYTGIFGLIAALVNPDAAVVCVEPLPRTASRVMLNAELNGLANVKVVNAAVSKSVGNQKLTLYGSSMATTGASLVSKPSPTRSFGEMNVETTTLEKLADDAPGEIGLVKIDTEGAELDVFAGGAAVLEDYRPVVLSEVLTDAAVADQIAAMNRYGYSAYFVDELMRTLIPINEGFSLRGLGYGNVIFCASDDDVQLVQEAASRFAGYPHESE